jgi:ectoine hydroxylase
MPPLSADRVKEFHDAGSTLARGFFSPAEIDLLSRNAKEDNDLDKKSFGRADGEGGVVRLSLWNHPGDGIYGLFARCERMVKSCEALLGDEVYHYHSKMILKDAKVGGAWTWHQDYGYWYQNGVLEPRLVSVFVAVDRCTKANGCLQVIPRSHLCGRINHTLTGEQAGADKDRVDELLKRPDRFPLEYVEMEPGDVLFFHANLLHRSDQNTSDHPRWSMICCYNAKSNDPYKDSHHPRYTPLNVVPDAMIEQVGVRRFVDSGDVAWLEDKRDTSAKGLAETQS